MGTITILPETTKNPITLMGQRAGVCWGADISDDAKNYVLDKGTNLKFGARPLRRAIQRYIEDEIAEKVLRGEINEGQNIIINFENDNLKWDI